MVTYPMNAGSSDASDEWQTVPSQSVSNRNQQSQQNQNPPSYYSAPNHFSTGRYESGTSPVAASAGARRSAISSYALPSAPQPAVSIEMNNLNNPFDDDPPAYNNPSTTNAPLPPPATQPNAISRVLKRDLASSIFPCFLCLLLCGIGICLHPPSFLTAPWTSTRWARPGHDESLRMEQVVFATVPRKIIWAYFLQFLSINVCVLQTVYWYAGVAARDDDKGKRFGWWKPMFFAGAAFVEAVLMWGWLLWMV